MSCTVLSFLLSVFLLFSHVHTLLFTFLDALAAFGFLEICFLAFGFLEICFFTFGDLGGDAGLSIVSSSFSQLLLDPLSSFD